MKTPQINSSSCADTSSSTPKSWPSPIAFHSFSISYKLAGLSNQPFNPDIMQNQNQISSGNFPLIASPLLFSTAHLKALTRQSWWAAISLSVAIYITEPASPSEQNAHVLLTIFAIIQEAPGAGKLGQNTKQLTTSIGQAGQRKAEPANTCPLTAPSPTSPDSWCFALPVTTISRRGNDYSWHSSGTEPRSQELQQLEQEKEILLAWQYLLQNQIWEQPSKSCPKVRNSFYLEEGNHSWCFLNLLLPRVGQQVNKG